MKTIFQLKLSILSKMLASSPNVHPWQGFMHPLTDGHEHMDMNTRTMRLTRLWFLENDAPNEVDQLIDVTVEHESWPTADLYATYDPWQSALLRLHVIHVLVVDESL